jgi:uncharacterized protein
LIVFMRCIAANIFRSLFLLSFLCVIAPIFGSASESVQSLKNKGKNFYYGIGVQQNYTVALQYYIQAAEAGDAEAQYISGGMYLKGLGVEKDFIKAFQLLHEAAKQGRSTAESEQILAQAFLLGKGVPKNYQKAIKWYSNAAEKGNKDSQNELGFIYFVGNGVEQDIEKGGKYFIQAAYNGLPIAQYNVGIMYYTGRGVKEADLHQSYAWFNIAAANGHAPAKAAREYLETVLSSDDLKSAQEYSEEILKAIANNAQKSF